MDSRRNNLTKLQLVSEPHLTWNFTTSEHKLSLKFQPNLQCTHRFFCRIRGLLSKFVIKLNFQNMHSIIVVGARIASFPLTSKVSLQDTVILPCRAVGVPTPKLIWKKQKLEWNLICVLQNYHFIHILVEIECVVCSIII